MASATGALTTTGSVTLTKNPQDSLTLIAINGTYGTVTFVIEGTIDGSNWFAVPAISEVNGLLAQGSLAPGDNTTVGWKVPSEGLSGVRARATAVGSGTANFTLTSQTYFGQPFIAATSQLVQTLPGSQAIGGSTAAAGTTTADAGVLPAGTAKLYPTTAADGTKGVRVHATDKVTGNTLFIGNGVSNQILKVYAPSGGTINGAAADAAFSSASGKGVLITCLSDSGNTWLAM